MLNRVNISFLCSNYLDTVSPVPRDFKLLVIEFNVASEVFIDWQKLRLRWVTFETKLFTGARMRFEWFPAGKVRSVCVLTPLVVVEHNLANSWVVERFCHAVVARECNCYVETLIVGEFILVCQCLVQGRLNYVYVAFVYQNVNFLTHICKDDTDEKK